MVARGTKQQNSLCGERAKLSLATIQQFGGEMPVARQFASQSTGLFPSMAGKSTMCFP